MAKKKKKYYLANIDLGVSFDIICKGKTKAEAKRDAFKKFKKRIKFIDCNIDIDEQD